MRKHIQSTSLPVFAVSLAVLGTMLPGAPARAEDDCIAKPNAPAPAGQHWWYRTDRATKRKCWFLGPQDKEAAALKADRREQAAANADEPEAQPAPPQEAPAPVARNDAAGVTSAAVPSFVFVPQESVPYLVDWTGLLKVAGIAGGEDKGLTEWADEKAARAAWAMRDSEPAESQPAKDEARAPQTPAGGADVARASTAPATPSGLPASYIAALLIGGAMGPAIFSILRARRRRNSRINVAAAASGADEGYEGMIPAFLQRRDARAFAPGQDTPQAFEQEQGQDQSEDYGRPYGGEEELRRILGIPQRRAA